MTFLLFIIKGKNASQRIAIIVSSNPVFGTTDIHAEAALIGATLMAKI